MTSKHTEFHAVKGQKKCKRCLDVKPVHHFHRHKATVDKFATNCRSCCSQIQKQYASTTQTFTARQVGYEYCDIKRGMAFSKMAFWNENYAL